MLQPAGTPLSPARPSARPPTVALANFDVERHWSAGRPGLPAPGTDMATAVVAGANELALLLGHTADWAVVKSQPNPGLVHGLDRAGLTLPSVLSTDGNEPTNSVTEDALASPVLLGHLRDIATSGARLAPHGFSPVEAELCELTGLTPPMSGPGIATAVNSKVFSRRLCRAEGIEQPPGWECDTIADLMAIGDAVRSRIADGATVAVKDAYGVSGKGIMLVDRVDRFNRLVRLLARQAGRTGEGGLRLVVEEWQDKRTDLNYHFTIGADAAVRFDFVLEAVTEDGTHRGHRLPARVDGCHRRRLRECADQIGRVLATHGYRGPVGVDAIVCTDGTLFPVIEINARNNMSTYLATIRERIADAGSVGLALQADLLLSGVVRFEEVSRALRGLDLTQSWRHGFLVTCFASVNAAATFADRTGHFRGRLHGVAVAGTTVELERLETEVRTCLRELEAARD